MAEETEKFTQNEKPAEGEASVADMASLNDALANLTAIVGTVSATMGKPKANSKGRKKRLKK